MVKFAVEFWWKMLLTIFPCKRSSKISFKTSPEVRHQFRRKLRQLHSGNRWSLINRCNYCEVHWLVGPKERFPKLILWPEFSAEVHDAKNTTNNSLKLPGSPPPGKSVNLEDFLLLCTVFPPFGPFSGGGGNQILRTRFLWTPRHFWINSLIKNGEM